MVQLTPTLLLLGAASYVSATATTVFPSAAGTTAFPTAVLVSGTFDGKMLRYERNRKLKSIIRAVRSLTVI